MRDFQLPGRSTARSISGMAATSHPLSTLAAVEMLKAGGNAFDAAICASAVQAVVEPQSTGIGGDCFVLFSVGGNDQIRALNGSGRSPRAATIEKYRQLGLEAVPVLGPHSVTIPGAIDAWARLLADHGRKSMAEVLEPAIHYAENGYVVADRVAFDWALVRDVLAADPGSAEIFLEAGKPLKAGTVHKQPALANTLRKIAASGRDAFYSGPLAEAMVSRLEELGGLHTLADFKATRSDYAVPISTEYKGYRIHQMPPSNQGLTALLMLNILSGFDLADHAPDSAQRLHLEIEAGRLAYMDRNAHLGEMARESPIIDALLSHGRAEKLQAEINPAKALTSIPDLELVTSDTVYISVVDDERNAVSFINSTYHAFGSGITCPETGVVFQNRGASFRLDPGHPNSLMPSKRPMHTIMPGMVTKDGHAVMPFGVMGGDYQPFGHVHLLTNLFDYGMDVQEALDSPRVFYQDDAIVAENGVPAETIERLKAMGHRVSPSEEPLGGGQAIWIDWETGTLTGGSDPRKDGLALGY